MDHDQEYTFYWNLVMIAGTIARYVISSIININCYKQYGQIVNCIYLVLIVLIINTINDKYGGIFNIQTIDSYLVELMNVVVIGFKLCNLFLIPCTNKGGIAMLMMDCSNTVKARFLHSMYNLFLDNTKRNMTTYG